MLKWSLDWNQMKLFSYWLSFLLVSVIIVSVIIVSPFISVISYYCITIYIQEKSVDSGQKNPVFTTSVIFSS